MGGWRCPLAGGAVSSSGEVHCGARCDRGGADDGRCINVKAGEIKMG